MWKRKPSTPLLCWGAGRNWASWGALVLKNTPANAGRCKRGRLDPWVGKMPWQRAWQPTPVSFPRESCGQRSLMGYSP